MSRVANCFICSTSGGDRNTISLIQDTSNLQSGKKLLDIVSEIAEKPLKEEDIHSTVICKKCSQTCKEYDDLQVRLKHIKTELHGQINKTSESPTKAETRKVVLPASKLHPLPPDFVLNVERLPLAKNAVVTNKPPPKSSVNLKVTVGSSVLTQSLAAAARAPRTPATSSEDFTNSVVLHRAGKTMGFEDCSYAIVTEGDGTSAITEKNYKEPPMFDVNLLESLDEVSQDGSQGQEQYIVGKLEILSEPEDGDEDEDADADDDGEGETIVMSDKSLLRVVSGQRLVYRDDGLALLDADDTIVEGQDDEDAQIELQVSGDEETANAIIAAAREQGGAFIKVESGQMYRVKSVESKPSEDADEDEFTDHMQIVEKEDGIFKCLLCKKNRNKGEKLPKWTGDAEFIMRHMRSRHDARVYVCRACGRALRRRDRYLAHLAQHAKENTGEKSKFHECNVCNKKYSSKTLLVEHMNLHSGQRPYTCEICHKNFASKYTYQSHLKTHLDRPRPFKCADCGKCFFTLQNLNQHQKTHSGVKEFECNICGKAFGTQHNLEMHGVVHSGLKPFVCGACGKAFARRAEVRDHTRVHTGERPFACDVCGATFSQRSNLHSHKRATHLDDKRYCCEQCPKRFKRRRLLDYHIKASHTGERPLKCHVCAATFVYPEHYKKHARIHSGEKPYVCEGHLAESIVVNQPRVTIQRIANNAPGDNVYESAEELELEEEGAKGEESQGTVYIGDKKYVLQEGKTSLNLVQDTGDILTYNLDTGLKSDANFLEGVSTEQLGEEAQTADGGVVRVLQVTLPDGNNGWVAINP